MKLQIIAIFFSICSFVASQAQGIDSLWKDNPSISDSAKLELLGETCYNLAFEDTSKSRLVCEEMLRITPNADNIYARINAYRTAGIVYQELENYNKTHENYSMAVKLASTLNDKDGRILYGKTLSNFGLYYHINGDFKTALELYLKADSLLEPFDLYNFKINIYSKLSDVYDHLGQIEQCNYYYRLLLNLAENSDDTLSMVTIKITMALHEMNQQKYNEAQIHLEEAILLAKNIQNPESIFTCYFDLGEIERLKLNYPKAIGYFKKAEKVARDWGDVYSICLTLDKLGYVYYLMGDFTLARKITEENIALSQQNEFKDILRQSLEVAFAVEDTLGNYKKALALNKEYIALLKEATDIEVRRSISFLDAKFQSEKREAQIAILETQHTLQAVQLSRNRLWIILLLALLCLVLVATVLMGLNYRYKRKIAQQEIDLDKQKIRQLEQEQQLIATQAVLSGEESERRRLARDLHDGLGGMLSGIKLKLSQLKGNFYLDEEGKLNFDRAIHSLDLSVVELRRVAHNLMPEVLIKYGLKEAVSDFCSTLNQGSAIDTEFKFYGAEKRVEQNLEITAFRIIQELVNNALKHSGAKKILVQLVQEEARLSLTVQDDGAGFDMSQVDESRSLGLSSIKSRVASLNGIIDIHSAQDKGTEIEIEFSI